MPAILPPGVSRKKGTGSSALVPYACGRQVNHDPETRPYLARSEDVRRLHKQGSGTLLKGSTKIYPTPALLLHACLEYAQWCDNNPHIKIQKDFEGPVKTMMTMAGLRLYLGITDQSWYIYRDHPEYRDVCAMVEDIMKNERIVCAANGILNAPFIARILGLVDKKELTGADGAPLHPDKLRIDPEKMSDDLLAELSNQINKRKETITIEAETIPMIEDEASE